MFKKLFLSLFLIAVLFTLASCGGDRTYVADGSYTAWKQSLNYGKPQFVTVTVTIKNDKIDSFFIDTVQSTLGKDHSNKDSFLFNEKSKKQLGFDYGMHKGDYEADTEFDGSYQDWLAAKGKLEWFQQAQLIEAALKEKGVDGVTLTAEGEFTNVANVTITDNDYVALAKEAVENAKAGKLVAVAGYEDDIIIATANVDKDGKVSGYKLDTLQGSGTNPFAFKEKTKQQLGYDYGMHKSAYNKAKDEQGYTGSYQEWLEDNNKLEWFEQVALICEKFAQGGSGSVTTNDEGEFTNVANVTISDNSYVALLEKLLASVKK